jgi:hypothetical protein
MTGVPESPLDGTTGHSTIDTPVIHDILAFIANECSDTKGRHCERSEAIQQEKNAFF